MPDPALHNLAVRDLGRLRYTDALAVQLETHARVLAGQDPDTLLLVEHDPVITVSQRRSASAHLLADPATLARLGIEVQPTDRGGDITYHGPGQLVAYPIVQLAHRGLNLGRYMRRLEDIVLDTVARWGVQAGRIDGCTGVWIADAPGACLPSASTVAPAKLCAMGVRVRRNVSLHGLALNVTTDLTHFATIVPCGLVGRGVTSLQALLGDACPGMAEVKSALIDAFRRLL